MFLQKFLGWPRHRRCSDLAASDACRNDGGRFRRHSHRRARSRRGDSGLDFAGKASDRGETEAEIVQHSKRNRRARFRGVAKLQTRTGKRKWVVCSFKTFQIYSYSSSKQQPDAIGMKPHNKIIIKNSLSDSQYNNNTEVANVFFNGYKSFYKNYLQMFIFKSRRPIIFLE